MSDIVGEFEKIITHKNQEIARQGALGAHGIEQGRRYLMGLGLHRGVVLINALWLHKIMELTLYRLAGVDLVHNKDMDSARVYAAQPRPHYNAAIFEAQYLQCVAECAKMPCALEELIGAHPFLDEHTKNVLGGVVPSQNTMEFMSRLVRVLPESTGRVFAQPQAKLPKKSHVKYDTSISAKQVESGHMFIQGVWQGSSMGNIVSMNLGTYEATVFRGEHFDLDPQLVEYVRRVLSGEQGFSNGLAGLLPE